MENTNKKSIRERLLSMETKPTLQEQGNAQYKVVQDMFAEDAVGMVRDYLIDSYNAGADVVDKAKPVFQAYHLNNPEYAKNREEHLENLKDSAVTFHKEAVVPALTAAALCGSGAAAVALLPTMVEPYLETYDKEGALSATTDFAIDNTPIVGAVKTAMDTDTAYMNQHPARFLASMLATAAPEVPAIKSGLARLHKKSDVEKLKTMRRDMLADDANLKEHEVERIVRAETDLQQTKDGEPTDTPSEAPTPTETPIETAPPTKRRGKRAAKAKQKRREAFKNANENVEPLQNNEVHKEVATAIEADVQENQKLQMRRSDLLDYNGQHMRLAQPTNHYPTVVTTNQILDHIQSKIPVRVGHMIRTAYGYFLNQTNFIRMDGFQQWGTLIHEVGHYVDKRLAIKGADEELIKAATAKWGDGYAPSQKRSEGIAEFMHEYVFSPEAAQRNFPQYYQLFTEGLAQNKNMRDYVEKLADMSRAWLNQDGYARVRSNMNLAGDKVEKPKIFKDLLHSLSLDYRQAFDNDGVGFDVPTEAVAKAAGLEIKDGYLVQADGTRVAETPTRRYLRSLYEPKGIITAMLGDNELSTATNINSISSIRGVPLHNVTFKDVYSGLEELAHPSESIKKLKERGVEIDKLIEEAKVIGDNDTIEALSNEKADNLAKIDNFNKKAEWLERHQLTSWHEAFACYAIARHAFEVFNRHPSMAKRLKQKFPDQLNTYQDVVDGAPIELKIASEKLRLWNENMLDLAVSYDLLSPEVAARFKKDYAYYVPFERDFSLEDLETSYISHREAFANLKSPFKTLSTYGSDRPFGDPIANMQRHMIDIITKGEKNLVGKAVAKLGEILIPGAKEGYSPITALFKEEPDGTLSKVTNVQSASEGYVTVWENGKRVTYQVLDKHLYRSLMQLDKGSAAVATNFMKQIAQKSASMVHFTAVNTPGFMASQLFMDGFLASVMSKTDMKPILGSLQGIKMQIEAILRKNPELEAYFGEFNASGVPFTQLGREAKEISQNLQMATKSDRNLTIKDKAKNAWDKGIKYVGRATQIVESAPRFNEYVRSRRRGMNRQDAAYNASDLTVNFMRGGALSKDINRYVPFFNATIQGTHRVARRAMENPVHFAYKGTVNLTMASLALWYYNHDQDYYRDASFQDKMRYWFLPMPDGTVIRLQKPPVIGDIFASFPERVLDYMVDNDVQMQGGLKSWMSQYLKMYDPTNTPILKVLYEQGTNKDIFRNQEIDTRSDQALAPEHRYNERTSEVAKALGQVLKVSPKRIDHVIRSLTTSMGKAATDIIDAVVRTDSDEFLNGLFKRFVHDPSKYSRSNEVFYATIEELQVMADRYPDNQKYAEMLSEYTSYNSEVRKLNAEIKEIKNSDMPKAQQEEEIKQIKAYINNIQIEANQNILGYNYVQPKVQ